MIMIKKKLKAPTLEPPLEEIPKTTERTSSTSSQTSLQTEITSTINTTFSLQREISSTIKTTSTNTIGKSSEDSATAIWIPIVSVVTVLFISAIIGLTIFIYSRKKCVTSKNQSPIKSQHLEKNYDLPY